MERTAKKLHIYCLGGAGSNLGQQLEEFSKSEPGFADSQITYVDTSLSNSNPSMTEANTYLLKDLDGSGKVRAENAEAISKSALDIINRFKPGDYNLLVSSSSGGSGSTLSPVLARHLLQKGLPVVVLLIGSAYTHIEAQNSLNTLKSFEGVSSVTGAPVVLYYVENKQDQPRTVVNKQIVHMVNDLKVLFSGQNRELDSKDLENWLRYEKATSVPPKLVALSICEGSSALPEGLGNVISVAAITATEEEADFGTYTEYRCTGIIPDQLKKSLENKGQLYFVISDGPVVQYYKRLKAVCDEMEDRRASRIMENRILDKDDSMTADGLVL